MPCKNANKTRFKGEMVCGKKTQYDRSIINSAPWRMSWFWCGKLGDGEGIAGRTWTMGIGVHPSPIWGSKGNIILKHKETIASSRK